jgi:site-specific recombinase XerD
MNEQVMVMVTRPATAEVMTCGAAETNPALVYLASLAPSGRRTMAGKLAAVAFLSGRRFREMQWSAMRFEHVAAWRALLQRNNLAPASVNAALSALRGVARAAWMLGLMTAEDYQRIAAVKNVRGERLPAGRALSRSEVAALFDACARDVTAAGARDAALLALLLGAGLRRSEVAALSIGDYDAAGGALRVSGKGDKQRLVYMTGGAAVALNDWLRMRTDAPGALICPVLKGGAVQLRGVTAEAIYKALIKRAGEAGVAHFSPHDLRRTFVSELLDAGADISSVQRLAGHASVSTTAQYDRRGEVAKRKAAEMVHVPCRPRT